MLKLLVFDVDGTLAEAFELAPLPGTQEFFELFYGRECPASLHVAVATNQGGVGMRLWMEEKGFGEPEKYPTHEEIEERMAGLLSALGAPQDLPLYISYRYQSRQGQWSPVPPESQNQPRWQKSWRKPNPGMLIQAMQDAGVPPEMTLFVGDSEDDQNAAAAAGCHFEWAVDFFGRPWETCAELEDLLQKFG